MASDLNVHHIIPILAKDARTTQKFGSSQVFSMKSTDKDVLMSLPTGGGQYPPAVNQEKKNLTQQTYEVYADKNASSVSICPESDSNQQLEKDEESPLLVTVRGKCITQLLLLGAIDGIQVWARIWYVLANHFISVGSHQDEKIAMYAIDSLRQLGMKYLEHAELANFTFQNDILEPFVVLMRNSQSESKRRLIVDCIVQMIKSKVGSIKSG